MNVIDFLFLQTYNLSMDISVPDLQLQQFVQYITNKQLSRHHYYDRHVMPFSQSCGICNVSFDFILRLETIQDSKPMLEFLGYRDDFFTKDSFSINKKRRVKQDTDGSRLMKEFQTLPTHLMKRLLLRYQYDLKVFGYHYNQETRRAWCSIKSSDGDVCC